MLTRRIALVAFAALLPASVDATPIHYSQLITSANTCIGGGAQCLPDNDNTGQQLSVDTLGPQTSTSQGLLNGGTGTGFAEIVDGVLHASATSVGGTNFFNGASASGSAIFLDTLTFVSTSLSIGTPVQLAFAIDLDYSLSGGCAADLPQASVSAQLHSFTFVDDTCNANDVNNASGVITVKIGDELPFQAILTTSSYAPGGFVGVADAANTFQFTIDPIGGNFSYIAASGNSFLTESAPPPAAPEPASLFLLGTGTAGLLARALRRRTQSRSAKYPG
ncbi:MAG: PEP-CTERM sorting domain-containing protein [Acidobacteria bacterium]|nr:PEP-CTERM sorting domain-containing protein [Acidobacteriota bacterium]